MDLAALLPLASQGSAAVLELVFPQRSSARVSLRPIVFCPSSLCVEAFVVGREREREVCRIFAPGDFCAAPSGHHVALHFIHAFS